MKKIFKYLFLLLLIVIPSRINAYAFNCEGGKHYINDSFLCTLSTEASETRYDMLYGSLTIPDELSCNISAISQGLEYDSYGKNRFSFKGQILENFIVKYKCSVVKDPPVITTKQILIKDFTYHVEVSSYDPTVEVLRSNELLLYPESDKTKAQIDTKSRDTSNPNTLLKSLKVSDIEFVFSKYQTVYNDLEVPWETEKVEITPEVNVDGAKFIIEGNTNLQVGSNNIDIKVISPDERSHTYYSLTINRLARGEQLYHPKKDAYLKTLEIEGYQIKFDKDVFDYKIKIPYEVQTLIINVKPSYEEATVSKNIPEKLNNGSKITITVKSEDGTEEKKYTIQILKDAPKKDYSLYYISGGFGFLIIVLVIVVINSNKKRQNRDPLLKLKRDKRTINKGNGFNNSVVPDSGTKELVEDIDTLDDQDIQTPNVINGAVVNQAAMPIQTNEVIDTNLNKTTSVVSTLDLSVSDKAQPINIPNSNNNQNQP